MALALLIEGISVFGQAQSVVQVHLHTCTPPQCQQQRPSLLPLSSSRWAADGAAHGTWQSCPPHPCTQSPHPCWYFCLLHFGPREKTIAGIQTQDLHVEALTTPLCHLYSIQLFILLFVLFLCLHFVLFCSSCVVFLDIPIQCLYCNWIYLYHYYDWNSGRLVNPNKVEVVCHVSNV